MDASSGSPGPPAGLASPRTREKSGPSDASSYRGRGGALPAEAAAGRRRARVKGAGPELTQPAAPGLPASSPPAGDLRHHGGHRGAAVRARRGPQRQRLQG